MPEHGQYHREDEQKRNINIQYSGKYSEGGVLSMLRNITEFVVCMNHGMLDLTNRNQWLL